MIRRFTSESVYLELRSDLLNIDQKKKPRKKQTRQQMNRLIQMRAIRGEDRMDCIDPIEGNAHIAAGSETDVKAKKDSYIYVKTGITETVVGVA